MASLYCSMLSKRLGGGDRRVDMVGIDRPRRRGHRSARTRHWPLAAARAPAKRTPPPRPAAAPRPPRTAPSPAASRARSAAISGSGSGPNASSRMLSARSASPSWLSTCAQAITPRACVAPARRIRRKTRSSAASKSPTDRQRQRLVVKREVAQSAFFGQRVDPRSAWTCRRARARPRPRSCPSARSPAPRPPRCARGARPSPLPCLRSAK